MSAPRRLPVAALFALAVGWSVSAQAESYRLAFSKAENIEIFVEHAAGQPWCSPNLNMRVVHGGEPDQAALGRLLPRLGALLDAQCPDASTIAWTSTTSDGRAVARGTSAKDELWAMRTTPETIAEAPKAQTPAVPAAPATPAPAEELETAPAPPVPDTAAVPAPLAPQPAPPAPATPATPPVAAMPAPKAVPPPDPVPSEAERARGPAPIPDFTVGGWQPGDDAMVRRNAPFLVELQDQNGCRIVTRFDAPQNMQYLSLKSDGLACGDDGYASGSGRLTLERSDGALIARTGPLWFAAGLPFNQEVVLARLVASDAQRNLWLYLAGNAETRTHYLLRARPAAQGPLGIWIVDPQVDAVTDNDDRFRNADSIRQAVAEGLDALAEVAMPGVARARIVFASDFVRGTLANDANHLAYAINAARNVDRRTRRGVGDWQFNLQQGTNYVFQRDARLAQQQRQEEQREAQRKRLEEQREAQRRQMEIQQAVNAERRNLQTYQQLVAEAERDPGSLRGRLESDVRYEPFAGGIYASLVGGGRAEIARIVRVEGRDGDDAKVDWPYDMRIIGRRDIDRGWYRVKGSVTVDPKQRDRDDLPLTRLSAEDAGLTRCREPGCADLLTPLAVARMTLGEPEWSPEAAEARIQSLLQSR